VVTGDRALLDGSSAGAMLDRLRADFEADHAKLVAGVPRFRSLGLDELVWARMCVRSRSFGLGIDGRDTTVLVPFVDMVNHERGTNTRWDYDPEGQAFCLIAQRAYQPGEEVCCNYGISPMHICCCITGSASMTMMPTRRYSASPSRSGTGGIPTSHLPS
jgi:hypothetical protein